MGSFKESLQPKRGRFVQDDDCHWYLIPASRYDDFRRWVESTQDGFEGEYRGYDFDKFRISGSPSDYSFVDARKDR